jgi:glycosyltransferase involved in cell wall biosynthesis
MRISVVVPGRNCRHSLHKLVEALGAQGRSADEMLFVDDASSDETPALAKRLGFHVLKQSVRKGPGAARNLGIRVASGDAVAFIDSDCWPAQDWLEKIEAILKKTPDEVIMGKTEIPTAGFWANAISDLGFPGGANLGFERVWKVNKSGYTDHISACNFAVTKAIFGRAGCFNERINISACEDVELSLRWNNKGVRIRYCPEVRVWHSPRKGVYDFVGWHFSRGRGIYQFRRVSGSVRYLARLRLWYLVNLILTFKTDLRLPILLFLSGVAFFAQICGYLAEGVIVGQPEPF